MLPAGLTVPAGLADEKRMFSSGSNLAVGRGPSRSCITADTAIWAAAMLSCLQRSKEPSPRARTDEPHL